MERLVILDSGGYGHTVADAAEQLGYNVVFLDDAIPDPPIASFTVYISSSTYFIPAFGNNTFRLEWLTRLESEGAQLATLIHPTAYVSPRTSIAHGTAVLLHAIENTDTVIERGFIINLGAIIDHGCIIEEGVHVCLEAIVKGENHLLRCVKIEAGEVVERCQSPL